MARSHRISPPAPQVGHRTLLTLVEPAIVGLITWGRVAKIMLRLCLPTFVVPLACLHL